MKLGRELFQFVFVLGLTKIGRELELDGLLLLLLLLRRHLMITLLLLFGRGLLGLLLISLLMTLLLLFGKYVRLTDVRPSETEKDLLELE